MLRPIFYGMSNAPDDQPVVVNHVVLLVTFFTRAFA
jgi:hypothetical protein